MTISEREKLIQDLEYLVSVSEGEARERYKHQLEKAKSR